MSKARSTADALQKVLDDLFDANRNINVGLVGTRAYLIAKDGKHPAGTSGEIRGTTVFRDTGAIVVIFRVDGEPDSEGWAVSPSNLCDATGQPLPTHSCIPERIASTMTETAVIAGPMYPQAGIDPVDQIFATFAPAHTISNEFRGFYGAYVSTDATALQQYMAAYGMAVSPWTLQQTAALYSALLAAHNVPTPEHVTAALLAAPEVAAPVAVAPPVLQMPATLPLPQALQAPAPIPPLVIPTPQAVQPLPMAVAQPLPLPLAPAALVPPVLAPATLPLAPAGNEVPAPKKPRPRKPKATGEAGEAAPWLLVMAALLPLYFEDPTSFEDDVAAAVKAIKAL